MPESLVHVIASSDPAVRNGSLEVLCSPMTGAQLESECRELDRFRRQSGNLYERVRALFFLSAIYRYHLPAKLPDDAYGLIPYRGHEHLLRRRFDEAIDEFLGAVRLGGLTDTLASALAAAYHQLAFQTLADQVRRSVRSVRGNQWMFRMGHPSDHPLRIRPELLNRRDGGELYPVLWERTPVRMDLSHSAWSDIFFLGMDFPEGARVLNISVDLGVRGRDPRPQPPVEVFLRVISEPLLRLVSVDLKAAAEIRCLAEVFDFAKDYLGLLKAGVIAAGIIPAGLEGSEESLEQVLTRVVGPGLGLEIVTKINDIPKGSRLAVSTNLLAALITASMRATGQVQSLSGTLSESERRTVAARAILGEWLGGSGGGWQDSGGIWPGVKMISGRLAAEDDPEWSVSRGRLLPDHHLYGPDEISPRTRQLLRDSFVLVHGGMAQNVGPILEMVTEKYLLRSRAAWDARRQAIRLLDRIDRTLREADVRQLAAATTENFSGPIQTIIPWATNHYTQTLLEQVRGRFGPSFWGFLMLGGMSGGGMGFIFDPLVKSKAADELLELMHSTKRRMEHALPFAMEPVVYDFAVNDHGTVATMLQGGHLHLPAGYYALMAPRWLERGVRQMPEDQQAEVAQFVAESKPDGRLAGSTHAVLSGLFPVTAHEDRDSEALRRLLAENGFDAELHEQIRADLRAGRIGLAQNRLSASTLIEDVAQNDVIHAEKPLDRRLRALGEQAISQGEVAVVSLAAGAGSRWTQGAGVVKALHPFHRFGSRYRSFLEVHLAKSRRTAELFGCAPPHVVTTGYLTHDAIARTLAEHNNYGYPGEVVLSRGRSVGLRLIPMPRDLRFAWEMMPQQILDEQAQKVRDSLRAALITWAEGHGGGSDYTDNLPLQCLHPVGHWFEVANLLRNGTLAALCRRRPQLKTLMLHNIDTLGADLDPTLLGLHTEQGTCLSFEVIPRRIEDRGGGLGRVNGQVRLIESLAMPRETDEFALTFYNSMTTWIDVDRLLRVFGLSRNELLSEEAVATAVRRTSLRLPTYITLKDVKRRWGHGQEDVFPVAQFEKLWGDMTSLAQVECKFIVVPRARGQQLKEQAQLDGWLRDGSADYVDSRCLWQ